VLTRLGHLAEARALLIDEAARVVEHDDSRAVWMLCDAAEAAMYEGNHSAHVEIAARVAKLGVADGGPVELYSNGILGSAQVVLGHAEQARTLFRRYREIFRSNKMLRHNLASLTGVYISYAWQDEYPAATRSARLAVQAARQKSDLSWLGYSLYGLAGLEFWTGHWDQAEADASEATHLTLETHQISDALYALSCAAYVAAGRGRAEDCRSAARQASEIATRLGALYELADGPLGLLLLGCGEPHAAIEALAPVARLDIGQGQHCPAMQVYDLIEAQTRAGQRDAALTGLATVERRAVRPWESAGALRCRGLLTAAPDCYQAFEAASKAFDTLSMPFERARTDLCHGELLRRAGQRTEARVQLQHALETFDSLGAAPWSKHARAELRASGATLRRGPAQHGEQLTPQELQIALHVADGKTNRQVAASLFLSPRTIELHLTRVYRKLGLHSRAELIHHFATDAKPEAILE
jgi:DNA-binding CsgD family transcriptional regulator